MDVDIVITLSGLCRTEVTNGINRKCVDLPIAFWHCYIEFSEVYTIHFDDKCRSITVCFASFKTFYKSKYRRENDKYLILIRSYNSTSQTLAKYAVRISSAANGISRQQQAFKTYQN